MSDYDEDPEFPGYYRYGLPIKTDFKENAFGIDPDGCGCTDCIIGFAFHPSDTYRLRLATRYSRILINRTGHDVILPNGYRLEDDQVWRPGAVEQHCPGCNCPRY